MGKQQKLNYQNQLMRIAGGTAIMALILLGGAMLFPVSPDGAQAMDCAPGDTVCTTGLAAAALDVEVASTVSVGLASEVQAEVIPKSTGSFVSEGTKLTVATNNPSGYALYMKTESGDQNLHSTTSGETEVIRPVEGEVAAGEFQANSWGYALNADKYAAVPAEFTKVWGTDTTSSTDTYDLKFGVAVDTTLPAGQYTNNVTVAAVVNPVELTSMMQLTYMQQMTADICRTTAGTDGVATVSVGKEPEKRLIDVRDGKSYWVAKLADQNCWMTQNLGLDITRAGLKVATTDIAKDWDASAINPPQNTNSVALTGKNMHGVIGDGADMSVSHISTYSWNFGEYVYATPEKLDQCYADGKNPLNLDNCPGFVNVSGWTPTFTAQKGEFRYRDGTSYYGTLAVDVEHRAYDAHYLVGNYYQRTVAYAGAVTTDLVAGAQVESSICPKGWKLPRAGGLYTGEGGFGGTVEAYGVVGNGVGLMMRPFYFVAAGFVAVDDGTIMSVGSGSANITSIVGSDWHTSYVLTASASGGYEMLGGAGVGVRCMVSTQQ